MAGDVQTLFDYGTDDELKQSFHRTRAQLRNASLWSDLFDQFRAIKRELMCRGYEVRDDRPGPDEIIPVDRAKLAERASSRQWEADDVVRYHGTDVVRKVFAGLFWYSGLGCGHYYSTDSWCYACDADQAAVLSMQDGVEFKRIDSFDLFRPTAVHD